MRRTSHLWLSKSKSTFAVILGLLVAGSGILLGPRLYAALFSFLYPPDIDVVFDHLVEPADFSSLAHGETITITVGITNNETDDLHGFYFSDQVPNGWTVDTSSFSVDGVPVSDSIFAQGAQDEIVAGFTPSRWALEVPQGDDVFSPTHPISADGGTAQIVYTMILNGGVGSDYHLDHHGWAGWLTSEPTGTAVYGYQYVTQTVYADFGGHPRLGIVPLAVSFTDLSTGEVLTHTWDFGDGGSSLLASPTYTYTVPGTYTVSLTVQNAVDSDTTTRSQYIHAVNVIHSVYLPIIVINCSAETCKGDRQ